MCEATYDGNKTLVCQLGDLTNGDQYRTPYGDTMLVLCDPVHDVEDGYVRVASIKTGVIIGVSTSIKLGRDRAGRLYASRSLNDPQPAVVDADEAKNQADKAWPLENNNGE